MQPVGGKFNGAASLQSWQLKCSPPAHEQTQLQLVFILVLFPSINNNSTSSDAVTLKLPHHTRELELEGFEKAQI